MNSPCLRLELLQYVLGFDNRYSIAHLKRADIIYYNSERQRSTYSIYTIQYLVVDVESVNK